MKRLIAILISLILVFALVPVNAFAEPTGSLTGETTVRAGDTIKLTFKVNGSDKFSGYEGALSYDPSVVTLTGVSSTMSNWTFSRNGNNLLAYNNSQSVVTMGTVFVATFTVNSGVSVDTNINVKFFGEFSGSEDSSRRAISGSYSTKVAPPLSNDATLKTLVVANAKLSPEFNPNTTAYTCGTVPFEISKLSISATANANGAKVSINGSNLGVGDNKVSIVVTAPNGAKKTYSITVNRQQDPNYIPSKNVNLAEITLSAGQLSPEFSADRKEYAVYLPFEVNKLSITAAAADPLAKGVVNVEDASLKVGLNKLTIKCTAEDGTEGLYTFYVVRMNEFAGAASVVMPLANTAPSEKTTEPMTKEEASNGDGVSPILLAVLGVACLILGFAIGMLIFKNRVPKKFVAFNTENYEKSAGEIDEEVMKYFDR